MDISTCQCVSTLKCKSYVSYYLLKTDDTVTWYFFCFSLSSSTFFLFFISSCLLYKFWLIKDFIVQLMETLHGVKNIMPSKICEKFLHIFTIYPRQEIWMTFSLGFESEILSASVYKHGNTFNYINYNSNGDFKNTHVQDLIFLGMNKNCATDKC